MNEIVVSELDKACKEKGLSSETCKVIKTLLKRKLDGEIVDAEMSNELNLVYEQIKSDIE